MKRKVQVVIIDKSSSPAKLLQFWVNDHRGAFWQNVTGSVDEGESFEAAARRELFEESSLNLGPLKKLPLSFRFVDRYQSEVFEEVYLAELTSPRPIRLSVEHQKWRLLPLEKVRPYHFGFISHYEAFLKAKLKAQF